MRIDPNYIKNDKGDIEINIQTTGATPAGVRGGRGPARRGASASPRGSWAQPALAFGGVCAARSSPRAPRPALSHVSLSVSTQSLSLLVPAVAVLTCSIASHRPPPMLPGEVVWTNVLTVIVINPKRERGGGGGKPAGKEVRARQRSLCTRPRRQGGATGPAAVDVRQSSSLESLGIALARLPLLCCTAC